MHCSSYKYKFFFIQENTAFPNKETLGGTGYRNIVLPNYNPHKSKKIGMVSIRHSKNQKAKVAGKRREKGKKKKTQEEKRKIEPSSYS